MRFLASCQRGLRSGELTLYLPWICLTMSSESRDDAEAGVVVVEGVLEAGEEAGVLGVVVGADAEELAEFGEDHALVVLDEGSVAGGAGVAAGAAVAVGVDPDGLFGDLRGRRRGSEKRLGAAEGRGGMG